MTVKTLINMKTGESGTIVAITGDESSVKQLNNLGLQIGKTILKVGAHLWRGPQVIKLEQQQLVVSHGLGKHISVEVTQ